MASGSTGLQARSSATAGNSFSLTQGAGSASRRHGGSSQSVHRIFCPVIGCLESLTSSKRHFRDLNSIRNHLNDHCTGHLSGTVPIDFLAQHSYSQCNVCDKILHTNYRGTCPKCRPSIRIRDQMNVMRGRINIDNNLISSEHSTQSQEQIILPNLSDIHRQFIPTIKSIPM